MSDPKEALERLKGYADNSLDGYVDCILAADLHALIAEREGLAGEVERLTTLAENYGTEIAHLENGIALYKIGDLERGRIDAEARAEAAEAKLAALIPQADLREEVANGYRELAERLDAEGSVLGRLSAQAIRDLLVSSTKGSGDQGSVASGLTPVVASRVPDSGQAMPSDVFVKGSVQILCDEIGFPFTPDLERSEVFVRFVGELIAEIDQHVEIKRVMAKINGKSAAASPEDEVLARSIQMIAASGDRQKVALAVAVHGLCDERNPDDAYPTNHTIDMLSSCASAIRFGLEPRQIGIGSRHAAEAASHVWTQVYGLTRLDEHTNTWRKSWACGKMAIAAARLSASASPEDGSQSAGEPREDAQRRASPNSEFPSGEQV